MKTCIIVFLLAVIYSCNAQTVSTTYNNANGIIYFSRDNGATWENQSDGLPDSISLGLGAIAVADNKLALATKEQGIFLFDFENNKWMPVPTARQVIKNNLGTFIFYKERMLVGTQFGGVFSSSDWGKTWTNLNAGLQNMTIRKLVDMGDKLYAGTNAGFYSYHDVQHKWELEYGNSSMQVNGITALDGSIYIGTNQGVFAKIKERKDWTPIFPNRSIHNISTDDKTIYAMVYNELFSSVDKGQSWQNIQMGLPDQLYTFHVVKNGDFVFAAQWDGVYRRKEENEAWKHYSKGLPEKLAVNNMKVYRKMIVAGGNTKALKSSVQVPGNGWRN